MNAALPAAQTAWARMQDEAADRDAIELQACRTVDSAPDEIPGYALDYVLADEMVKLHAVMDDPAKLAETFKATWDRLRDIAIQNWIDRLNGDL